MGKKKRGCVCICTQPSDRVRGRYATNESLLPVYIFIQGGGFNLNGNANYNGGDLIDAANHSMVVVNFNYRVGPYGFLASKEVVENKTLSLNNGLKDQRQLLKWVKDHIQQVGQLQCGFAR